MPEYLIPLRSGENRSVKGASVRIEGFEEFQFYVHRAVPGQTPRPDAKWSLTELRTGASVAFAETRVKAISTGIWRLFSGAETPKRLRGYVEKYLRERLEEAMKEFGKEKIT